MTVFPEIQYMAPEEQERARRNLLAYCRLDTLAMVKVWEELRRAALCGRAVGDQDDGDASFGKEGSGPFRSGF